MISQEILNKLKKLGLVGSDDNSLQFFSTGIKLLDHILGAGYPYGKFIELFGSEGSGKSYLSLITIASVQKENKKVALFDVENSFDPKWASKVGVDINNLLVLQSDYGEQVFEGIEILAKDGFSLIVVDSTAALVPKCEIDKSLTNQKIDYHSKMISKYLRDLTSVISKTQCSVIFINQLREVFDKFSFLRILDSPGGKALKFYSSIRIKIEKMKYLKDENNNIIGHVINIKVVKNKLNVPYKSINIPFYYCGSLDEKKAIVDYLFENNKIDLVIKKLNEKLNDIIIFDNSLILNNLMIYNLTYECLSLEELYKLL